MTLALPLLLAAAAAAAPGYRTHNDRLTVARYASPAEWQRRAAYLKEHILASHGLLPPPEKTPLRAQVFDERKHDDYSVAKVYFESLAGFFVTGNLYTPAGRGPFPAVLLPHGHWTYGRLENTEISSIPGSAISLARQGFVAFTYDMVGYDDSRQVTHALGGRRESLWGLSLAGLQLWNGIRSLDFLQSRPEVDPERIGAAGASGGGTQTFLLAAVDERVKVAVPVNMISLHMQGGCLCENPPGLRLDTNNVELAATIAPRPLLMISATGDWTSETPRVEYPEMRKLFALAGAEDRVQTFQVDAPHNYNRPTREALYAWMARWLQKAPADVRIEEKPFQVDPLPDLLVFQGRPLPEGALTAPQLTEAWIAAARRQWAADAPALRKALLHALALEPASPPAAASPSRVVVLASEDAALTPALRRAGFAVHPVRFTPFDAEAASKIEHFETYNRTPAAQRVADIAHALRENPGSILVADGDAALAGALALAVAPADRAVLGVGQFDTSSDAAYMERLYLPGLRRAGDLQTALAMAKGPVLIHDAGARFEVRGPTIEPRKLDASEIVRRLRLAPGRP
jgi:dienelactone hydrolase family protein